MHAMRGYRENEEKESNVLIGCEHYKEFKNSKGFLFESPKIHLYSVPYAEQEAAYVK